MDAKDILGLPKSFPGSQEKRHRPQKDPQRKPDGISREVYALTGGISPLIPTIDVPQLKRRPAADKEKITWQWLPFSNSARIDNLQLYHWARVVNGVPPTGDYQFAKYNKSADIAKYTEEEYEKYLTDPMWTKEETDQLFDMCDRYDLRFIVIADRFPSSRTAEELKGRYYSVSRALLIARAPSAAEVAGHPLVKEPYNMAREIERKRALSTVFSRTRQQESRDAEILSEAKRIMELRIANKGTEIANLPDDRTDIEIVVKGTRAESPSPSSGAQPSGTATSLAPMTESASIPASLRMLRIYLRTHALDQMVQAASSNAGPRTIKRVEQTLSDLGIHMKPKVPTKAVCTEHLELRKEILTLFNLQKQLQNKETEASVIQDNSFAEAPDTPKRIYRGDTDRPFVTGATGFEGVRMGKRDIKRKAPGRFTDVSASPPQSKRPRKMKTSDA